jgi:hypothetical protein
MSLPGDQRALLQLLCERGQSYSDIAGLLGTSPEDVRAKARAALTEIGGGDPDAEVGLTDYLLGQADPIGRADAVRYLQSDPEAHALATRIEDGLREIAPAADLPKLPEPRGRARRAAVPAAGGVEERPRDATPGPDADGVAKANRQTRVMAALAGAGVILVFVVLAIAGVFSGDDEPEASAGTETTASADGTTDSGQQTQNVTEVKLKPSDDSGVAGTAAFGIVDQSQLYVDVSIDGLDPKAAKQDAGYFLWLMIGEQGGYPLPQPLTPDENGRVSGRIAVPTAVATTVAGQASSVNISLPPVDHLPAAPNPAARDQVPIVTFTGTELAAGKIPLAAPAGE